MAASGKMGPFLPHRGSRAAPVTAAAAGSAAGSRAAAGIQGTVAGKVAEVAAATPRATTPGDTRMPMAGAHTRRR